MTSTSAPRASVRHAHQAKSAGLRTSGQIAGSSTGQQSPVVTAVLVALWAFAVVLVAVAAYRMHADSAVVIHLHLHLHLSPEQQLEDRCALWHNLMA
jgi:hypothetical protein